MLVVQYCTLILQIGARAHTKNSQIISPIIVRLPAEFLRSLKCVAILKVALCPMPVVLSFRSKSITTTEQDNVTYPPMQRSEREVPFYIPILYS